MPKQNLNNISNNILRIDASMRKNGSYSRQLTNNLITKLNTQQQYSVKVRDLTDPMPFIDETWITANFTHASQRNEEQITALSFSDVLVTEIQNADIIVIGLPIYNFAAPAAFKAWIDQIARAQVTFRYSDNGPVGLLNNKKAYVIITSGGTQVGSDIDFISDYMRHVLQFIGIKNLTIIDCSGIARDENKVLEFANEVIAAI